MTSFLIVDDHPRFRALARLLLESEGYAVVGEADDGGGALTRARELSPDVVLLDVHLPDATGFEVADRLAREHPGATVVMTSTHEGPELECMAQRCGAAGFLPKDELSGTSLRRLLG